MMNPFCASVGFDAFIALRSIPSQVKMTPKTLTHFEGVSGRQIRNADCKHSNRASIYRNYTGPLLESFAPFIQNGLGSEPSQGCLESEEHTSELQSLMRISYDVFCLKKNIKPNSPYERPHTI